jgi:hypothetical protein
VPRPDGYAEAIRNIDRVITGHGEVMSWQDFVDFGEFNRDFLQHERAQFRTGKSPQQTLESYALLAKFKGYNISAGGGGPFGGTVAIEATFAELKKE